MSKPQKYSGALDETRPIDGQAGDAESASMENEDIK